MSEERKYCTLPVQDSESLAFDSFQTNRGSLAMNADKTEVLVVYTGNKPRCIYGIPVYTNSEMKARFKDPNDPWYQTLQDLH